MKTLFNKQGSFSIFAIMLFMAIIISIGAIIKASGDVAVGGSVNSFGNLWAKSILGEYDIYLKNRYGILGFYGEKNSIENKLLKYIDYSFKDKSYIDYTSPSCSLEEYSLGNTANFREQVEMIVLKNSFYTEQNNEDSKENIINKEIADVPKKTITAGWIIESLPSYGKTENTYVMELAQQIKNGISIEKLTENIAVDSYIIRYFKDYTRNSGIGETYFECEVEYILTGELDENLSKIKSKNNLVLLRNILNLYYLYTCPEKRESAMSLASTLTPGPQAVLTQAIILEAWAYMEAENDLKILYDNKTVPLLKKDCNWALSLEEMYDSEYVVPDKLEGLNYSNYLRILLCGMTENTKLLRIMDLIQINMKYIYCDYFLIKDYYSGLTFDLCVNGKVYEFEDSYIL